MSHPDVDFKSDSGSYWTLILTNPGTKNRNIEMIQCRVINYWFIGLEIQRVHK
jgi:hypothetical protein